MAVKKGGGADPGTVNDVLKTDFASDSLSGFWMRTLGSERHIGRFTEILLEKWLKQFVLEGTISEEQASRAKASMRLGR